jgi:hypothetical protein
MAALAARADCLGCPPLSFAEQKAWMASRQLPSTRKPSSVTHFKMPAWSSRRRRARDEAVGGGELWETEIMGVRPLLASALKQLLPSPYCQDIAPRAHLVAGCGGRD